MVYAYSKNRNKQVIVGRKKTNAGVGCILNKLNLPNLKKKKRVNKFPQAVCCDPVNVVTY